MLTKVQKKSKNEIIGVGIDDQAALIIENNHFRVVSTDGLAKITKVVIDIHGKVTEKVYHSCNTVYHISELIS